MLQELARLLAVWRPAFPRYRNWLRGVSVLLGLIVAAGRRTVTASIAIRGKAFEPWAPDHVAFLRAPWAASDLFDGVVDAVLQTRERFCEPHRYLLVAVDDTSLRKTGKAIAAARWLPAGPAQPAPPAQLPMPLRLRSAPRFEQPVVLELDRPLARVGEATLTARDPLPIADGQHPSLSPGMYAFLLQRAIDRELLRQAAAAAGLVLGPTERAQLDALRRSAAERDLHDPAAVEFEVRDAEGHLFAELLLRARGVPAAFVDAAQVRAWYESHQAELADLPANGPEREAAWHELSVRIRLQLQEGQQRAHAQALETLLAELRS